MILFSLCCIIFEIHTLRMLFTPRQYFCYAYLGTRLFCTCFRSPKSLPYNLPSLKFSNSPRYRKSRRNASNQCLLVSNVKLVRKTRRNEPAKNGRQKYEPKKRRMAPQDMVLFRERIHGGRHRRSDCPRDRRRGLTHAIDGPQYIL